jgi:hypothetical protein
MDRKKAPEAENQIELEPDAWERFERFIKGVAKAGPQHRPAKEGSGAKAAPKSVTKRAASRSPK